jgi:hypothetical protein
VRRWFPLLLLAAGAVVTAAVEVPLPVVERFIEVGDRMTRLSLFDDRTAVVSIREGDRRVAYHQERLSVNDYRDIIERLTALEGRVQSRNLGDVTLEGTSATIRLSVPGGSPRLVDYSLARYQDEHTAELVALLDDLQRLVTTPPLEEAPDLLAWNPRVGQRVELRTGTIGVVTQVYPSGLIVIEEEDSELLGYVTPETRTAIIRRLVEDGE